MKRSRVIDLKTVFPKTKAQGMAGVHRLQAKSAGWNPPPVYPADLRFYGAADWSPKLPDPIWLTEFRNLHGSATAGNYILMATRSSSPTVLIILNVLNPDYLHLIPLPNPSSWDESYDWTADYGYRYVPFFISLEQLQSRYSSCDAACYSPVTKKAYLELYGGSAKYISVIELDPKTGSWTDVIMDPIHVDPDAYSNGGVICCDDDHLYLCTYGVESLGTEAMIYKYALNERDEDGQLSFVGKAKMTGMYAPHSMGIRDGKIWVCTGIGSVKSIVRIDAATLVTEATGILTGYNAITDDLTLTETDVWIGIEMGVSGAVRIDRDSLEVVEEYLLPDSAIFGTYCFGAWYERGYIYLGFGKVEVPVIARINPETGELRYAQIDWAGYSKNPELGQWGLNEICYHPGTGYFYASLWDEAPPVIVRFKDETLTWLEVAEGEAPGVPVVKAGTEISATGFIANWEASIWATGYLLDVSADSGFGSYLEGYHDLSVAETSAAVTGLSVDGTYYYRVRAVGAGGTSEYSATESVVLWTPNAINGLKAWLDAYTAPESVDESSRVISMRCRKTNNQLTAQATETTRPTYDAANKRIIFTAANKQKLSAASFFTDEPFKSATKGMGQAWTFIWVGSTMPTFSLHSAAGANGNFRAGGNVTDGGLFGINYISGKTIYAIIKPAASNLLRIVDTFSVTAPYALSGNSPVPTVYLNDVKQSNGSSSTQATSNGTSLASGGLSIGNWATLYYNTTMNEMLMYAGAIAESDLLLIISYLMAKWGIAGA